MEREERQRRILLRNRRVATAILVVMAATFFATGAIPDPGFWIAMLHATSEAGLVGGLADWFAVTAVFRQPLGLPIPHTAIIPRNKNRIGEGLGSFLERHFLTADLLLAKLRGIDPALRLAGWIAVPANAEAAADRMTGALPHVVRFLDDARIRTLATTALHNQLLKIEAGPLLGRGIELLTATGYQEAILDRGIEYGLDYLDRNAERLELAAAAGERRRWWIPKAVDRQIAHALLEGLRDLLHDLQQPDHAARKRLLSALDGIARELTSSPERRAEIEAAKIRLLEQPEIQVWLDSIWDRLRDAAVEELGCPSPKVRDAIATALASAGQNLLADERMRARINDAFEDAALAALPLRAELGRFFAEVVRRWDERGLVTRMELVLGADLQYVRITGTLVGGCVGCVLFLLVQAYR